MLVKKNNGSILLKVGLVLVVLAVAGYFALLSFQESARVKLVGRGDAADAVTGTVAVDADGKTKDLTSEAGGRVVKCDAIDPTRKFKESEILVQLDDSDLIRARDEAERQFRLARERARFLLTGGKPELLVVPNLTDAEREKIVLENNTSRRRLHEELENAKRLYALGNVAENDLKKLQRGLEDTDTELKLRVADEKKLEEDFAVTRENTRILIEKMKILAPADGQIDEAYIHKGALIGGGHRVATWFSKARIVAAKISEESFGRVQIGQKARIRLLSYGTQYFDATVSKLHPKADDAQRFTVYLDVKIDEDKLEDVLKPNSTGEVTITIAEHPKAIVIPRRALFSGDKVWVVKDGVVERRQVKIGFDSSLNVVEVLSGLQEGEQIIVDRLEQYRPGQRVKVQVVE